MPRASTDRSPSPSERTTATTVTAPERGDQPGHAVQRRRGHRQRHQVRPDGQRRLQPHGRRDGQLQLGLVHPRAAVDATRPSACQVGYRPTSGAGAHVVTGDYQGSPVHKIRRRLTPSPSTSGALDHGRLPDLAGDQRGQHLHGHGDRHRLGPEVRSRRARSTSPHRRRAGVFSSRGACTLVSDVTRRPSPARARSTYTRDRPGRHDHRHGRLRRGLALSTRLERRRPSPSPSRADHRDHGDCPPSRGDQRGQICMATVMTPTAAPSPSRPAPSTSAGRAPGRATSARRLVHPR